MTNRDLIKQLKELKRINPDKEWVALTYSKLLSNTSISYIEKPNSKLGLFGGLVKQIINLIGCMVVLG